MIGDRAFREAVRTVTVSYPIPFLAASAMTGGVVVLGLYAATQLWPLALAGTLSVVSAIALAAYAVIWKPELLRSERHTLQQRLLDIIGDGDLNPEARMTIGKALTSTLSPSVTRQPGHRLSQIVKTEEDQNDD